MLEQKNIEKEEKNLRIPFFLINSDNMKQKIR